MHRLRPRALVGLAVTLAVSLVPAVVLAVPASASPIATAATATTPSTVERTEAKAVSYAEDLGYRSGIAVYDRKTHVVTGAGSYDHYFPTESTVKVFIAARLLVDGEMSGDTEATAYRMITQSDDNAADALYGRVGGDSIEPWTAAHFHIKHLGRPPIRAGWWGNTKVTPEGMVRFYAKVARDPVVGPWLLNAMHHAKHHAADGFDQFFGLKVADPAAAIKQGWGGDNNSFDSTVLPSTGFVGHDDRYAVAIYTMHRPFNGYSDIRGVVDRQAELLMPHGRMPNDIIYNPHSKLDRVDAVGSTVTVQGWAWDPDRPSWSARVRIYDGDALVWSHHTSVDRPRVNKKYGIHGDHGVKARFDLANGHHTICLVAVNTERGTGDRRHCATIKVNGSPRGRINVATVHGSSVRIRGWVVDPDDTSVSADFVLTEGAKVRASGPTTTNRPKLNARKHFTGIHGFDVTLKHRTAGPHRYCVTAVNYGSHLAPDTSLGCVTVHVG